MNLPYNQVRVRFVLPVFFAATMFFGILGCNSNVSDFGGSSGSSVDALSGITLLAQNGHPLQLASLKGKPVLFDFIYTTCPGPCLVLTARMKAIANQLGPDLGAKASLVSVTVDPEHDRPTVMHAYAKQQGAERNGWFFLTGSPAEIDQLMSRFKLVRQREADGTVDHVLEFLLVGPDGHPMMQYLASDVMPAKIAGDMQEVIAGKQLALL
jgi:cytochrome oxidase Cu insertion factor (SCO1/SenC/PrrC family)